MAIDLVGDVMRDIQRMYKSPKFTLGVVRPAIDAHAKKMLQLTKQAKNPQGGQYKSLDRKYAGKKRRMNRPPVPDLRLGENGPRTMDTLYSVVDGNKGRIGFDKDRSLPPNKRYMHNHNYGKGGMPKRQIFPEGNIVMVGPTSAVYHKIKRTLIDYLMTPRQIKGTVRG